VNRDQDEGSNRSGSFKYSLGQRIVMPHDVQNIVPADYNADGRLDMLVMMRDDGAGGWWTGGGSPQTDMTVILGSEKGLGE
jgi:hypothetical protein